MPHSSRANERPRIIEVESTRPNVTPRGAVGLPSKLDPQVLLRAARSNCTLLICGETGVGKGHLARWIHDNSSRSHKPFIPVNCGAIPETLVDSQLFGHVRGAFSGATENHIGLVRAADGGSLLLDEVSELPPSAQTRLLRLLQDREVQPVGLPRPILVDVRIIAATNIDLRLAVGERRFREDLLFRLDVIRLHVPPLRERMADVPQLLQTFNAELSNLYKQPELEFKDSAMAFLNSYHWPGNVRQVRTLVERLHVLCPSEPITIDHVVNLGQLDQQSGNPGVFALDEFKRQEVQRVLSESGGSIARAAEKFGVHRSTIYRWLRGS